MSSPFGNTPYCCSSGVYQLELLPEFLPAEFLFVLLFEFLLELLFEFFFELLFEFFFELPFEFLLELLFEVLLELPFEFFSELLLELLFAPLSESVLELVLVILLLLDFLLSFPPQAVADTAIIATIPRISPFFMNPFIFFSAVFLFCIVFVLSFLYQDFKDFPVMTVPDVSAFDGSYYQAQTLTNPERILNKSKILRFLQRNRFSFPMPHTSKVWMRSRKCSAPHSPLHSDIQNEMAFVCAIVDQEQACPSSSLSSKSAWLWRAI